MTSGAGRAAGGGTGLFDGQDAAAWRDTNRAPFLFRHHLASHPLFELPRIARLAALSVKAGSPNPYLDGLDPALGLAELTARAQERIEGLADGSHWVKIIAIDRLDPEYDELMRVMLKEVEALSGQPIGRIRWAAITIFLNSPHLVVPYHFDHDTNFLMQIRGRKVVELWDPSVVSLPEIEDFYKGNMLAGRYRDEIGSLCTPYPITPGMGVHHPPHAPHVVRNGAEVSISVSFYYTVAEQVARARVHQCNVIIRKLGMKPRAPGRSPIVDRMKSAALDALSPSDPGTWHEMMFSCLRRIASARAFARRAAGQRAEQGAGTGR